MAAEKKPSYHRQECLYLSGHSSALGLTERRMRSTITYKQAYVYPKSNAVEREYEKLKQNQHK
jgi:hypothetical protein